MYFLAIARFTTIKEFNIATNGHLLMVKQENYVKL